MSSIKAVKDKVSKVVKQAGGGGDSKYFASTKKGEVQEFKTELRSLDRAVQKEAVKKVIAAMTVGKDVSSLFPDVVNCSQTEDTELKKLTYLYMINYAKTAPDLAIMAVNTFVKDSMSPNPLIRALAVRTMGCIRVDKISEYLCDPLARALKDDDPYVRKTAAICVAKLYDISNELVESRGFIEVLQDMLSDGNPMVVANAVAALAEIHDLSGREVFQLNNTLLTKLLQAVNDCTEWGQVFILDSLANYEPRNAQEAEMIADRVAPRLQHVNAAVVLSAVKVIIRCIDVLQQDLERRDKVQQYCRKMAPPIVTLLSSEPEVQYVALRNIEIIIQRWPEILSSEVKVFFCKYNDPVYVKLEKIDIMVTLANEKNIEQVLLEFKEYAAEVDVEFVRKAVRAIGRCAISLESSAQRCVDVLLDLIRTRISHVVQESIVVIKDIFRRYPYRYETALTDLCEHLESLDEPEARAAMIWIVGEYSDRIDNAEELLAMFLETFPEEPPVVQLQLLTATVKLFLRKPTEGPQTMIQLVLSNATAEADNPDLRDRAYIYWRLLSTDPEIAKDVVLSEMPVISSEGERLDPALVDELIFQIGSLAAVYHKPPASFVTRQRLAVAHVDDIGEGVPEDDDADLAAMPTGTGGGGAPGGVPAAAAAAATPSLLDLDVSTPGATAPPPPKPAAMAASDDLLGDLLGSTTSSAPKPAGAGVAPKAALPVVLDAGRGRGLEVRAAITKTAAGPSMELQLVNRTPGNLDGFMVQFNKNFYSFAPQTTVLPVGTVPSNGAATATVAFTTNPALSNPAAPPTMLQVALKSAQLGVCYYVCEIPSGVVG